MKQSPPVKENKPKNENVATKGSLQLELGKEYIVCKSASIVGNTTSLNKDDLAFSEEKIRVFQRQVERLDKSTVSPPANLDNRQKTRHLLAMWYI